MESVDTTEEECSVKQEPVEETPVGSNRKERKRTHCINLAFGELRKCIPNVPTDTKLSKIKTLRLAISYIQYLTEVLDKEEDGIRKAKIIAYEIASKNDSVAKRKKIVKNEDEDNAQEVSNRHSRTGWPQHVWALDLR